MPEEVAGEQAVEILSVLSGIHVHGKIRLAELVQVICTLPESPDGVRGAPTRPLSQIFSSTYPSSLAGGPIRAIRAGVKRVEVRPVVVLRHLDRSRYVGPEARTAPTNPSSIRRSSWAEVPRGAVSSSPLVGGFELGCPRRDALRDRATLRASDHEANQLTRRMNEKQRSRPQI